MLAKRIIPCLDVKEGRVVKGVNFINLRDAGDPVEQARVYDAQGADELVFLDISATHEGRQTMVDVVRRVAVEVLMPFAVGGGVRTIEDIRNLLLAGADKVSINSAAVRTPEILSAGAERFGSQCIVLAVDAKRVSTDPLRWEVYVSGGRTPTGLDAVEWSARGVELGAGRAGRQAGAGVRAARPCHRRSRSHGRPSGRARSGVRRAGAALFDSFLGVADDFLVQGIEFGVGTAHIQRRQHPEQDEHAQLDDHAHGVA